MERSEQYPGFEWHSLPYQLLLTPDSDPTPLFTPGGTQVELDLEPENGARAQVTVPPDAPGGGAVLSVFAGAETPPSCFPVDQVFLKGCEFVLNEKPAEGRVIVQFRGISDTEAAMAEATAQSVAKGWSEAARDRKEITPEAFQILVKWQRGTAQREVVVANVPEHSFLLVEDLTP